MFEVTAYKPPYIFVTSRRTGETYQFLVGDDGTLAHDGQHFDQGEPRRAATAFLSRRVNKAELLSFFLAG
jgi:hypothetical protein